MEDCETKLKKFYFSLKKEIQRNKKQLKKYSPKKGYSVYCNLCKENISTNEKTIKQLEEIFPDIFGNT